MAAKLRCVVFDIDETLLFRTGGWLDRLRMYLLPGAVVGTAYPGATQAVKRLQAQGFTPIFLSARLELSRPCTHAWLSRHDLPTQHVHLAPLPLVEAKRAAFKADALRELQAQGMHIVAGVGDRPSDMKAYSAVGALPVGVAQGAAALATVPAASLPDAIPATEVRDGAVAAVGAAEQTAALLSSPPLPGSPLPVVHTLTAQPGTALVAGMALHGHADCEALWRGVTDCIEAAAGGAEER